jgi:hypothetical protein
MMIPHPSLAGPVITRSFGVAVFLHALGHSVEHVRSRDGSIFNCYFHFPADARADLEEYYRKRDELNAISLRRIRPTNSEETIAHELAPESQ